MPKPVTAVNTKAGTLCSMAVRRRVDMARTKGHPTPAQIPSYEKALPRLSASTGHGQKKTCSSMCPEEPRRTQTRRSGCTHHPGVAPSLSFCITTWYQALLLLEAAHVLVWTCTSPVLRDKHVHVPDASPVSSQVSRQQVCHLPGLQKGRHRSRGATLAYCPWYSQQSCPLASVFGSACVHFSVLPLPS